MPLFDQPGAIGTTYDAARDRLRLLNNTAKVLALLLDGEWHSGQQLREVGGHSGDRRARLLRPLGFDVKCEAVDGNRSGGQWRYRITRESITPERVKHALEALDAARQRSA
ncbi:MAG TPA: hypothetical protein VFN76_09855 [Candidatus Limnocylindria bacterium]|nr:hypothetical protein [Candidatus Limnocylindria bacterium]